MQVRIWEKQYYLFFKHGHIAWLPAFKTCACVPKTWLFFLADKVIRPLYKSCLPDEKKKKKDQEQDLEHSTEELRFGKLHKLVAHI